LENLEMKKTLVAIAALAAFGAQAQSSVTMYGIADVGYVSKTHTGADGAQLSKVSGIGEGYNAGNRIGFKGTEDLGAGKTAGFVIEQGINLTNGQLFSSRAAAGGQQLDGVSATGGTGNNMPSGAYSTATNRQAFVSFADKAMGEVRAGYQYTALYTVSTNSGYHLGSEQPGGDLAHGTLSNADFGGTRANGITYIAPTMGGVTLTVQKGAASGREDVEIASPANGKTTDKNNRWSILANYTNGPLNASYAHTSFKTETSAVTASVQDGTGKYTTAGSTNIFGAVTNLAAADAKNQDNKLDQLAGSYQLGAAKLTASYAKGQIRDSLVAANSADTKAQQIGGEYAFGAARPFLVKGTGKITKLSDGSTTFDAKSTQFGVRYDLSKRTVAYVISGKVTDDAATSTTIKERKGTAIGLFHSF
jgi:predicted porin